MDNRRFRPITNIGAYLIQKGIVTVEDLSRHIPFTRFGKVMGKDVKRRIMHDHYYANRMRNYLAREARPEKVKKAHAIINSMTNWQRNQWAKKKYPGCNHVQHDYNLKTLRRYAAMERPA